MREHQKLTRPLCAACHGQGKRQFHIGVCDAQWNPDRPLSAYATPRLWCWNCQGTGYIQPRRFPKPSTPLWVNAKRSAGDWMGQGC